MLMLARTFRPARPTDLRLTLGPLGRGARDPTMRLGADGVWRVTRTPAGVATVHLSVAGDRVRAEAWGPGAEWAVTTAPRLLGADDDDAGFAPRHPVLAELHRRLPGLRLPCSHAVVEALVPTILEQKVPGREARASYARLVRAWGEPAPGPAAAAGLMTPPAPARLATTGYAAFHPMGVERRRADTVRRVASVARRLEETTAMAPEDAYRRLRAVPGVGVWTTATMARIALGDPDAVPVGDYHLPHLVSWALAGEPRGDDTRMLELLEPYRGQRARVLRLLEVAGPRPPRRGPRLAVPDIRSW